MPVFGRPECQDGMMLVTPRPGLNRENLLKTLQSVYTDVYNLRGGGGAARNAHERLLAYVEWASAAVRMLGNQVSNGDLDRLVLTGRYRLLLAGLVGTMTSTEQPVQRVVNGLVSLELDERVAISTPRSKRCKARSRGGPHTGTTLSRTPASISITRTSWKRLASGR